MLGTRFQFVIRCIALAAVFSMLGGHWVVLQSIAWSRMLVDYSSDNGLKAGISMTFDGDHPCPMCCAIQEAKKSSNPTHDSIASPPPLPRLEAVLASNLQAWPRISRDHFWLAVSCLFPSQGLGEPPVPPPRFLTA